MKFNAIFAIIFISFVFANCQTDTKVESATTSQGFEIQFHKKNKGESPVHQDYVTYNMVIQDGEKVINSTFDQGKPQALRIVDIDDGTAQRKNFVQDALLKMTKGDSVTVLFPLDSLQMRPPGVSADAKFLNCHISLVDIMKEEAYQSYVADVREKENAKNMVIQARLPEVADNMKSTLADFKASKISDLQKTDSGLEYVIHKQGTGAQAEAGKTVSVQYYGVLKSDGSMFDASFSRGPAITFGLGSGQVIPGWDEGIALLKEGGSATLFIPYTLAYGEAGRPPSIPEKSDLVFYVELEGVK
jgi:FKBP-type peptidyl-prolyl cis-trans isomerase FkpA